MAYRSNNLYDVAAHDLSLAQPCAVSQLAERRATPLLVAQTPAPRFFALQSVTTSIVIQSRRRD